MIFWCELLNERGYVCMMNRFYFSTCVKYSDKKNCFNLHLLTCLNQKDNNNNNNNNNKCFNCIMAKL